MKRVVSVLSILLILFLVGCNLNENINNKDNGINNNLSGSLGEQNQEEIIENEKDLIKKQLVENEKWYPKNIKDQSDNEISLNTYYGSSIKYANDGFVFNEDNTFTCFIGAWGENDSEYRGIYSIDEINREITFTYNSGRVDKAKYTLSENNTILDFTEEKENHNSEKIKILFVPMQKENEYQVDKFKDDLINNTWKLKTNEVNNEDNDKKIIFYQDNTFYSERGYTLDDYHTGEYIVYPEHNQITLIYEDGTTMEILLAELDDAENIVKLIINDANLQGYEYVITENE